jgi:hypothetical protein
MMVYQQLRTKSLNLVQFAVLSIINPARLLIALRSHDQEIRDQYNALVVKTHLEQDLSLGVQKELVRLMVEENKKERDRLWWLIPIFLSVAAVVGQSLIQDLVYENTIKPLVCSMTGFLCQ